MPTSSKQEFVWGGIWCVQPKCQGSPPLSRSSSRWTLSLRAKRSQLLVECFKVAKTPSSHSRYVLHAVLWSFVLNALGVLCTGRIVIDRLPKVQAMCRLFSRIRSRKPRDPRNPTSPRSRRYVSRLRHSQRYHPYLYRTAQWGISPPLQ